MTCFSREIGSNKFGCVLLDIEICSSVQADDIALMATSEYGMPSLINICESHSREWAFKFSLAKSNILLYSKQSKNITCNLTLYKDPISMVTSAKHVGVPLNSDFNSVEQTLNACRFLRTAALALLNSGIHPSMLNPLTCAQIIKSVCYSRAALYGCELWNNLNQTELLSLERAHRFICKTLQGLPFRTIGRTSAPVS